jgi:transcription antitermination factor NusA-like protein
MINTIDMKDMRHLNLFSRITHIDTRFCFTYNEIIFFCVPKKLVSKAIGTDAKNIRKMNMILKRKIRILPNPVGIEDAEKFIQSIISPIELKELKTTDNEIILTAGSQNKAALIGRNKRRFLEMQRIVSDYFKRDFKLV